MDVLFEEAGAFGRFQKIALLCVGSFSALSAMIFYIQIFSTSEPDLNCFIKNETIRKGFDLNKNNFSHQQVDTCQMWNNYTFSIEKNEESPYKCEYDDTYYGTTIVNDWNLVCGKQSLASLTQTFFLIGSISAFVSGIISDKFGRRKAGLLFSGFYVSSSLITNILLTNFKFISLGVMPRFIIYNISQFLGGVLVYCIYNSSYVLLIELTTHKYHTLVSNFNLYLWIVGELLILAAYYISRNWIISSWMITTFSFMSFISFYMFVPESPRWLAELGRFDEAYLILKRIARINKKKSLEENKNLTVNLIVNKPQEIPNNNNIEDSKASIIFQMFCPGHNFFKLLALIIVFNSVTLNYIGVSLGITTVLHVNPYMMYLLSSVFEFIGISICHLNDRLGRKKALLIYLMVLSSSTILVALLPDDPQEAKIKWLLIIKTISCLLAKTSISASFNTLTIFTAELYDVKIRNTVIIFLGCIGCCGSLLAPQINLLGKVWKALPYLTFTSTAFLSCVILFFLPETYSSHHSKEIH